MTGLTPPLLHPFISARFTWGGLPAKVHATRRSRRSIRTHKEWFYLELPDGSFHEVQFCRLRKHLECDLQRSSAHCIAIALRRESNQCPEKLRAIAYVCGTVGLPLS